MVWHVYHFLGDFVNTWLDGQIMDGPIGYTLLDSTTFAMSPLILNFLQDTLQGNVKLLRKQFAPLMPP